MCWKLHHIQIPLHPRTHTHTQGEYIDYKGDPLQDFTMMHFLDRFVYKNPKQQKGDHGGSLMQKTSRLLSEERPKSVPGKYLMVLLTGMGYPYIGIFCVAKYFTH